MDSDKPLTVQRILQGRIRELAILAKESQWWTLKFATINQLGYHDIAWHHNEEITFADKAGLVVFTGPWRSFFWWLLENHDWED